MEMASPPFHKRPAMLSNDIPSPQQNQAPVTHSQAVQQLQIALLQTLSCSLYFCDKNLLPWLRALRDNAAAIAKETHISLLQAIFQKFDWGRASNEQVLAYTDLLLNILSASNTFARLCFKHLVENLKPRNKRDALNQPILFQFDEDSTERISNNVHQALQSILSIVPSASTTLFWSVEEHFPNYRRNATTKEYTTYLQNILRIIQYYPPLRDRILDLCVEKTLQLDVAIKLEDAPDEEEEEEGDVFPLEIEQPGGLIDDIASKLDGMMDTMFQYLQMGGRNGETATLWTTLLRIFEEKILPTQKSKYTQFLVFFLSEMDKDEAPIKFVEFLKAKIFDSRIHLLTRMTCTAYVGSFISRASFVPIKLVRTLLSDLTSWCVSYLRDLNGPRLIPDGDVHRLFYQICQNVFYIVCFHSKRLFQAEGFGIKYFYELQLEQIATSTLNPLKFCATPVAIEFGKICGYLGVVSCCEIVEANKSLVARTGGPNELETFFPFDPYKLRNSAKFITNIYNEWASEDQDVEEQEDHDDDSPSSSLGSDLQSMSLTPVRKFDMSFMVTNGFYTQSS